MVKNSDNIVENYKENLNKMNTNIDLTVLNWTLSGWQPNLWQFSESMELGERQNAEIKPIPAAVPGSVQMTLKNSELIPDWNYGFNARYCEWVENRHWIYEVTIPSGNQEGDYDLICECLDYSGWIVLDGQIIGEFHSSFEPAIVPLKLTGNEQRLEIVFDMPPRFIGQFGWSSKISDMKPRFYYTWDWIPRLVQTGIAGNIYLRLHSTPWMKFRELWSNIAPTNGKGIIRLSGEVINGNCETDQIQIVLVDGEKILRSEEFPLADFNNGIEISELQVELWWPHTQGNHPLYDLQITLNRNGNDICFRKCHVGFRSVRWISCQNAPPEADPWICELNNRPIFLQGVNWTPIRPNYADVPEAEYRKRIEKYRDIGINLFRVWGGTAMEKECFYDMCDEYGILIWQDFPLSSSGLENLPPSDSETMKKLLQAADHYLDCLTPHVSLLMWCGGNELQRSINGLPYGCGVPCTTTEPLLKAFEEMVSRRDSSRRFVPTSSSGPRFYAEEKNYGKGLHWDVHGPWKIFGSDDAWQRYWDNDDALFRSEIGCPGASPAALIKQYAGNIDPQPGQGENLLWHYPLGWWNEVSAFISSHKRNPKSLEEYVTWSQKRQAEALRYSAASCKSRFPNCGGIIIWMGHDSFPICANTSILDYNGEYKPAALALRRVFCD
jgi:beta-mannosidase